MQYSVSLLALLTCMPGVSVMAAPPDNCCCLQNGSYSVQKFCTRNGGSCASDDECSGGGGGGGGDDCNTGSIAGGPKVAMAWVSDQYANFDTEWTWANECTNRLDPYDADSNQFKCCHDWLVSGDFAGINTVSLAFLKPTEILDPTTCAAGTCTNRGVRVGMPGAIDYFYSAMDLVFVSIGGATYTSFWEEVLVDAPTAELFAEKVAAIAVEHDVGVEIDYEESADPNLAGLEAFVRKYREIIPFEDYESVANPPSPPSFMTIDFGQGAQFMGPIANWVAHNAFDPDPAARLLNWANAMVAGTRQSSPSAIMDNWRQHIHGYSTLQTAPIAPAHLVGGIWSSGGKVEKNCISGDTGDLTLTKDQNLVNFVNTVQPCVDPCGECEGWGALPSPTPFGGTYSQGMLGYAYWMVGNISPRRSNTCPDDIKFQVYGTDFEGDGDCAPGFRAVASEYGIVSEVNWTSRAY